jgi:hypothetical protein
LGAGTGAGGGAGWASGFGGSVAQPAASASATRSIHTLLIINPPLFSRWKKRLSIKGSLP